MATARTRRGFLKAALAASLAGLSFFAASRVLPLLPLRHGEPPNLQQYPEFGDPGPDAFYAVAEHTELSHAILYHDLGSSIANARRADVLFLGNSRMPLGLREEFLVPEADKLGLRLFSLGCGYAELLRFPLELIKKHDLRPRVVVVSGGPHMFFEGVSSVAEEALAMTRWDAAKQWLEVAASWNLRTRLHAALPRLDFFDRRLHSDWVTYRSARTGWWRPVAEPRGRYETKLAEKPITNWSELLPFAEEFHRELVDRGAQLVLTLVPYVDAHVGHLAFLSDELGVPAIVPSFDGVTVADGSHLNRESAGTVSLSFWEAFLALPEVRDALGIDRAH